MSQDNLVGMDEGALRKLLEATLDLAERRRIRSAIRELQRQELERDEEALASKRFRPERGSHRQDDKENWPRSRRLEEEQQTALAALSRQLEAITDVEELTKLLRAAGEYEERKLIRAAIRKLRAEEIEAAALAGNVQSSQRDGSECPAVPGDVKSSQRDDAETPALSESRKNSLRDDTELTALAGSRESCGEGSAEPLATAGSGESSQQDDAEQSALAGPEESSYRGAAEQPPAEEPGGSAAHKPDDAVKQEHVSAGMQELCSQEAGDPQKPSTQAVVSRTLVLPELQLPPEPSPEPEDGGKEPERAQLCSLGAAQPTGQHQAAWKEGSPGSPASTQEPGAGQSRRVEQPHLCQPGASSQLGVGLRGQVLGPAGRHGEPPVVAVPTQDIAGTQARLNTHRWEQAPSSPRPAGRTEPSPAGPPRASSVRERAQRFTPTGPGPAPSAAGAGSAGGRAGPGQWQRGPHTAPPGPAQNARAGSGGGAEQRPAPVPAGPRPGASPGLDGMKTYFTIEIKDGRMQPLTPRVVAAPGGQRAGGHRAEVTLGLRSTPIRITTIPSSGSGVCSISSVSSNVIKDPCAHFEGTEEPSSPVAHPPAFSSMRQQSTLHLSRSNSGMEPEVVEQPQTSRLVVEQPQTSRLVVEQPQTSRLVVEQPQTSRLVVEQPQAPRLVVEQPQAPRLVVEQPQAPRPVVEQPQAPRPEPELPNGMEKVQLRELERRSKLNIEELNRIEDEDVLDKMLDRTTDFEERRLIRNAMRELRQRKRDQREKERDQRLQETRSQAGRAGHATETTTTQSTQSADGSARSSVTKTERLIQSSDGTKTSRTTTMESSYLKRSDSGNSTFVQTKSSYSSSSKKTGSIFDREDESASRQSSLAALERRQAEKKKELMKAQSLPKTSASQARKAMMEKLQKEGGSSPNPAPARSAVQRSSSCVTNANSIKQMLLDWCRAKTRGYEHVDIQNFSSSWSDGMAFCALVHNFFPEAFDYSQLTPQNRRHNFEVAFSSAEKHADCPQLLDVEDMVRMREPDWKCVYTYIQEFYRCLVQKGLVKTKKS
ncbi:smoothelin isoform X1 [Columba livia]|uniref:smoothelin isoform X1 n=1 Tax=Columba livia TaxID=8932 RepID=UPI0031BAA3F4